jgi:glycosyltransferase involved in cell wall biosynthesis
MKLIAVIPAFNEAARVGPVVRQSRSFVEMVVVVDDGSRDDTAAVAEAAGAQVVRHEQNRGKGAAIQTGLRYLQESGADAAVFLDADGQHDPNEIPRLAAAAEATGAVIVVGSRMADVTAMPRVRLWTNRFMSWLTSKLARQAVADSQCGYRLVRREVVADLRFSTAHFETETEMLIQAGRAGHRMVSVPVRTIYPAGRQSHIRPLRDTIRFLRMVARYW